VGNLHHRHRGSALQHLVGRAGAAAQVQDHDQGHAGVGRHVAQQRVQGIETAGRGADADDGKAQLFRHADGCALAFGMLDVHQKFYAFRAPVFQCSADGRPDTVSGNHS